MGWTTYDGWKSHDPAWDEPDYDRPTSTPVYDGPYVTHVCRCGGTYQQPQSTVPAGRCFTCAMEEYRTPVSSSAPNMRKSA